MSPLFRSIYRFISALFCAVFLLVIGAGTSLANQVVRTPTDPVILQLKWTNAFQFAGYYVAKELGYYRAAGLQVEIKEGKPGINVINEVVEGKANFGISSSNLLIERAKGKPVVALAVIMQHSPLVLITRKDKKIQSIHDLKGKRIMIDFARGDEILAYLKSEKISQSDFITVEHSFDLNDLVSGKVDAMTAYSTNDAYALSQLKFPYQTFSARSGGIDFYNDILFTSERELAQHGRRVEAFRAASLRGWEYAMSHPDEAIKLIQAHYPSQRTYQQYAYEAGQFKDLIRPDVVEIGYMNPGRWAHIAETYTQMGAIEKSPKFTQFLYKNDSTQEYQYASQIFYLVIAILAIGLFASFFPPQGFKLLSVTTIYWPIQLALIAISSILFSITPFFSTTLLIPANTALVGVYLMQALQARSWSTTISRKIRWCSLISILIFVISFAYLLEAFPSSIHYRVRLVGAFLMAYLIWSTIETSRVKNTQRSLQLDLLFWLSIVGIAIILSRLSLNMFALYLNPSRELVTIYQEDAVLVITRLLLGIQMMAIALTSNNYYLEKLWLGGAIAEKQKRSTDNKNIALLQVLAEKNQLLKKLAVTQKASDMGTMVSSLAHELNQPLGAIRLNAEVLLDLIKNAPNSEEPQEILADILKDNIRAADIITRLKRLFQKGSEQFESINLAAIVNDAYLLVKSKCSAHEIEVALDIPVNALVYGDVGQLQMVVLNLFNNAIEELVSKQGERLIFASIQCEEEKIIFEISDNGSGISTEAANHIFELFHTSKPSGMGVGLWLSRAIMETHNGAITVENIPAGGTCFRLTFYQSQLKPALN